MLAVFPAPGVEFKASRLHSHAPCGEPLEDLVPGYYYSLTVTTHRVYTLVYTHHPTSV